jgi:hypothetical protein
LIHASFTSVVGLTVAAWSRLLTADAIRLSSS